MNQSEMVQSFMDIPRRRIVDAYEKEIYIREDEQNSNNPAGDKTNGKTE